MSDFDRDGSVLGVLLGGIAAGMTASQEIQESMARELIARREATREIKRLADVCRGYFDRNGAYPSDATTRLIAEILNARAKDGGK